MPLQRRMVVLAEGKFSPLESKTANQVIRYIPEEIIGIVDSTQAGRTCQQIIGFGGNIPILPDLRSSIPLKPNALLIGVAPTGGKLPESWRGFIKEAIGYHLDIISGLHTFLAEDEEFKTLARSAGVHLFDLRKVPPEYEVIAKGSWKSRKAKTILTVGTDCNVGKMTASLELHREFVRRGLNSYFVATGQTGILLSGRGIAIDSVLSDYVAGAIELEVEKSAKQRNDYIHIEGQGSLTHQGFSSVTLGLMHGVMPDAMILVHHPIRHVDDYGLPLDDVKKLIDLHEAVIAPFKTSKIIGIAVNGVMMRPDQVKAAIIELEKETGLPAADVLTPAVKRLADAVLSHLKNLN